MKRKRLLLSIFIYCLILSIICIVGTVKNKTQFSGKTLQSAFLNEKYKPGINYIQITFPDNPDMLLSELKLKKTNEAAESWTCTTGINSFAADEKTISQLIDVFASTRNLILLSDKVSDWKQFDLSESEAICISFFESSGNSDTLRSKLYFGKNTTDYTGVYVRNDKNPYVYRVEDNVTAYLTDDINFWCDLSLLRENQNDDENSLMSISAKLFDESGKTTTINLHNDGTDSFIDYAHKLLSLRGSRVISKVEEHITNMEKLLELSITGYNSTDCSVQVFSTGKATEAETKFFVQYSAKSEKGIQPYFVEISAWTYRNLLPSAFM